MTPHWLVRASLRLVPASWRGAVQSDLEDEARADQHGAVWSSWQTVRLALPLRWAVTGDAMFSDLRYAFRSLRASPLFAGTAVVTFALGIGVNVAVFSAVDRMLFRPLPYADAERLMFLRNCNQKTGQCFGAFPASIAFELQRQSATVAGLGVVGMSARLNVSQDPHAEPPLSMIEISPGLLGVLGVTPVLGRDVNADEVTAKRALAWLSHETWTARFNANENVLGRPLWAGTQHVEIIGVLPRGFIPPGWLQPMTKWDGLVLDYDGWSAVSPTGSIAAPVVRLKAGASRQAAAAEIASLVSALPVAASRPGAPMSAKPTIRVDPVRDGLLSRYRSYLWLVVAAAGAVLAVAAANLSTLLLVRGRARANVGAVCAAMGASRWRLARVALFESVLVCGIGAIVTVVMLAVATGALRAVLPPIFARYAAGMDDLRVLGFALLVTCVCGVLAGLWPAWRASRIDLRTLLHATARTSRLRAMGSYSLLAVESALGTTLVVGGALCVRSFVVMAREDLGFVQKDLYVVNATPAARPASPEAALAWYDEALRTLKAVPGVRLVGGADAVVTSNVRMRGLSSAYPRQGLRYQVTAGYFETVGTQPRAGRTFTESEVQAVADVAIVNAAAARLIWPNDPPESVVGRVLQLPDVRAREVVGVVPDFKSWNEPAGEPALFLPKGSEPSAFNGLVIRMEPGRPLDVRTVQAALAASVGDARLDVRYVPTSLEPYLVDPRFRAVLLGVLAVTGLVLAAIGLYAVASADVATRRFETGVRLALGATAREVSARVIRDTCRPVLAGVALGLLFSFWSGQFVQSFLHQVDARDPWTYVLVALTLTATAIAAAWLPARRAASTDPATVLRAQ